VKLDLSSLNYWAVLTAAVATFLLGGAWYTALFGKLWVQLNGYSEEKVAQMKIQRPPPLFFGVMIVSYLLLAFVVAILVTAFGLNSALAGAKLGLLLWMGPAVAIGLTSWVASDKRLGVYAIDLSYQLVFLVMTGALLAAWR
jgi:hypothetical protein